MGAFLFRLSSSDLYLLELAIVFYLERSKVRFHHLLLALLSVQFSTLAYSTSELDSTIVFNSENLLAYIEPNSILAENWKMSEGGNPYLVPGNSYQQYGSSAFQITPAFNHSKLILSFFNFPNSLNTDLDSCNFYVLADRRKIDIPAAQSAELFYSSLEFLLPEGAKNVEIGVLTPTEITFHCQLKLYSISIEERSENNDLDNDGITNNQDNCPSKPNVEQLDSNFNGIGDNCTFNRAQYFSLTLPITCEDSPTVGPDNDADGISDLCDPDDDNDTISDLDEIHWGMDVFTAFDFGREQNTDHDNDGILSTDEIELGYSPLTPNYQPTVNLNKYLLNHDDSLQTIAPDSDLVYHYTSNDNQSFSFRTNSLSHHYDLTDQLLLAKTSVKAGVSENAILADFEYAFEPNVVIFPSPVLIDHEYKISTLTTVTYIDHITQERIVTTAMASIVSKINLSENKEILSFSYTLHVYDNDTSELIVMSSNAASSWNESEGLMGLGWSSDYIPLIPYTPPSPIRNDISSTIDSPNNNAGGAFNFTYLILLLSIAGVSRITESYRIK